jgi:peptide deformylase
MSEAKGQVREREERDAEREARRRYVLSNVRQYPDPVLRMKTRDVTEFDVALVTLVERMRHIMERSRGVGLAAPQVGVLRRVLIYQVEEDADLVALVNPVVVEASEESEAMEEGCLSLDAAGVTVEVERPLSVTVEAMTPAGETARFRAEGLEARVIQHEIDHLEGVLIIDRTTPEQRRAAMAELRPQPVLRGLARSA